MACQCFSDTKPLRARNNYVGSQLGRAGSVLTNDHRYSLLSICGDLHRHNPDSCTSTRVKYARKLHAPKSETNGYGLAFWEGRNLGISEIEPQYVGHPSKQSCRQLLPGAHFKLCLLTVLSSPRPHSLNPSIEKVLEVLNSVGNYRLPHLT